MTMRPVPRSAATTDHVANASDGDAASRTQTRTAERITDLPDRSIINSQHATLKSQQPLRPAKAGMRHTIESSRRAVQSCDILLTNAIVLTMDERFTVHRPGSVAIAGDTIRAIGPEAASYTARDIIDCHGRVVM